MTFSAGHQRYWRNELHQSRHYSPNVLDDRDILSPPSKTPAYSVPTVYPKPIDNTTTPSVRPSLEKSKMSTIAPEKTFLVNCRWFNIVYSAFAGLIFFYFLVVDGHHTGVALRDFCSQKPQCRKFLKPTTGLSYIENVTGFSSSSALGSAASESFCSWRRYHDPATRANFKDYFNDIFAQLSASNAVFDATKWRDGTKSDGDSKEGAEKPQEGLLKRIFLWSPIDYMQRNILERWTQHGVAAVIHAGMVYNGSVGPDTPPSPSFLYDDGDIQWRGFKANLPILFIGAVAMGLIHFLVCNIIGEKILYRPDPSNPSLSTVQMAGLRRKSLLTFGFGLVFYLHGAYQFQLVMVMLTIAYYIGKYSNYPKVYGWILVFVLCMLREIVYIEESLRSYRNSMENNVVSDGIFSPLFSNNALFIQIQKIIVSISLSIAEYIITMDRVLSKSVTRLFFGLTGPMSLTSSIRFLVIKVLSFVIDASNVRFKDTDGNEATSSTGKVVKQDAIEMRELGITSKNATTKLKRQAQQTLMHDYTYMNFLCYSFFPALYIAGPLVGFEQFLQKASLSIVPTAKTTSDSNSSIAPSNETSLVYFLTRIASLLSRWIFTFYLFEIFLHSIPGFALMRADAIGMLAEERNYTLMFKLIYWVLPLLWMKFYLLWRFFQIFSLFLQVEAPENMQACFNNTATVTMFWRGWHSSFNVWCIKYIYFPFGGSRVSSLKKIRNVAMVFLFTACWHDIEWKVLAWGGLNGVFVAVEMMSAPIWNSIKKKFIHGNADDARGIKNPTTTDGLNTYKHMIDFSIWLSISAWWGFNIMMVNSIGFGCGLEQAIVFFRIIFSSASPFGAILLNYLFFIGTIFVVKARSAQKYTQKKGKSE